MTRFAPALLVLLPVALCAQDKKTEPVVVKSKEGKFSVMMSAKPTEKTNKVKSDVGDLDLYAFLVEEKDRASAVLYSDYPAGYVALANPEKVLDGCITGTVNVLKGKLLSEEKITLGKAKHTGREIRIETPDKKNIYRARLFLVGDRLYQVVVAGADEFTKSKAVEDFLKSFAVDE